MGSEARFNGETKSVQTKPFARGHCLGAIFVAGIKVAILKYDPTIFLNLEAEETG